MSDDLAHELRVMARLMETKASITWREQDAAQLRKAADEIERLRAALRIEEWRKILNDLVAGERAENERLRAALSGILLWWDRPNGPSRGRLVYLIEAARAALKGANLAEKS